MIILLPNASNLEFEKLFFNLLSNKRIEGLDLLVLFNEFFVLKISKEPEVTLEFLLLSLSGSNNDNFFYVYIFSVCKLSILNVTFLEFDFDIEFVCLIIIINIIINWIIFYLYFFLL